MKLYGNPVFERPDLMYGPLGFMLVGETVFVRDLKRFRSMVRHSGWCFRCGESVRSLPRHGLVCAELGVAG